MYYHDWHRTRPVRAPTHDKPGVHRLPATAAAGVRESIFSTGSGASGSGVHASASGLNSSQTPQPTKRAPGLPFDEETKLVYGVVLSLRNMVKKLSGK